MSELALHFKENGLDSIASAPLREMVSMVNQMDDAGLRAWEDTSWKQWRGDYSDMSPW